MSMSGSPSPLQHLPDFKGIETLFRHVFSLLNALQHLPDFKGIETINEFPTGRLWRLQHLPDFKGIETLQCRCLGRPHPCSTSLTSKGLRLFFFHASFQHALAAPP